MAKRLQDRGVAMMLMTTGNELDPVFDSLLPVIAWVDAVGLWPSASRRRRTSSAQSWTVVKGSFGAVVTTLKRMQWIVFEHDSFLWCVHDGRIVDPRRVCPHSMLILHKKAARTCQ